MAIQRAVTLDGHAPSGLAMTVVGLGARTTNPSAPYPFTRSIRGS